MHTAMNMLLNSFIPIWMVKFVFEIPLFLWKNQSIHFLEHYIPRPKVTTTFKSWQRTENSNQFYDPEKESCSVSQAEISRLLGCVVAESSDVVMSIHFYKTVLLVRNFIGPKKAHQWVLTLVQRYQISTCLCGRLILSINKAG